jgi:predicted enzyme related to lactoylglutathione lyase
MTITTPSTGQPIWADLGTPDIDAARTFYSAVMGWTTTEGSAEFGGYATAVRDAHDVAGIGPQAAGAPPAWLLYFSTDDADALTAAIEANGGTVFMRPHGVGDMGRLVVAADPTGAVFGLWEPGSMPGFGLTGAPGAWAWCDLRTDQPDAAREFYGAVFGWEYAAVPMAGDEYTTFTAPGSPAPAGGVGPMMGAEGVPPLWLNYFAVDDVDRSLGAVTAQGGTIITPAFDTPFGRMAPILDPAGAALMVMQLPPSG